MERKLFKKIVEEQRNPLREKGRLPREPCPISLMRMVAIFTNGINPQPSSHTPWRLPEDPLPLQ